MNDPFFSFLVWIIIIISLYIIIIIILVNFLNTIHPWMRMKSKG